MRCDPSSRTLREEGRYASIDSVTTRPVSRGAVIDDALDRTSEKMCRGMQGASSIQHGRQPEATEGRTPYTRASGPLSRFVVRGGSRLEMLRRQPGERTIGIYVLCTESTCSVRKAPRLKLKA